MGHSSSPEYLLLPPEYEVVKDPVHGYIRLYGHEREIINSKAFQRLRRIKQTVSAHYVYPGATHTRFSHSLGVMHISGMFVNRLLEPLLSCNEIKAAEAQRYFFLIRLWGLVHDIGHGPFSHVFDEAILKEIRYSHESLGHKILTEDPEMASKFDKISKNLGITVKDVSELMMKTSEEWEPGKNIGRSNHYDSALYHVLLGSYSCDIIDYLLRDSLFTGAGYGDIDWQRLLTYSRLHQREVALEKKAEDSLCAFLLARLLMFGAVYYHKTSRAFDKVAESLLVKTKTNDLIKWNEEIEDVNRYLKFDEESIVQNQRLSDVEERDCLLFRRNPFSSVFELRIPMKEKESWATRLAELSLKGLPNEMRKNLEGVPEEAFFVDSPNLLFNPTVQSDEVCFIDTSVTPPIESRIPIHKAFWVEMPHQVCMFRLYVSKTHADLTQKIKGVFEEVVGGTATRTSFY